MSQCSHGELLFDTGQTPVSPSPFLIPLESLHPLPSQG